MEQREQIRRLELQSLPQPECALLQRVVFLGGVARVQVLGVVQNNARVIQPDIFAIPLGAASEALRVAAEHSLEFVFLLTDTLAHVVPKGGGQMARLPLYTGRSSALELHSQALARDQQRPEDTLLQKDALEGDRVDGRRWDRCVSEAFADDSVRRTDMACGMRGTASSGRCAARVRSQMQRSSAGAALSETERRLLHSSDHLRVAAARNHAIGGRKHYASRSPTGDRSGLRTNPNRLRGSQLRPRLQSSHLRRLRIAPMGELLQSFR